MRLIRFVAACALALAFTPALAAPACFTATDKPSVPVWMQAPPPAADAQAGYAYYPATVAATVQVDKLRSSKSGVQGAYWQWSNHGPRASDGGAKGNITPGSPGVQIRFSTSDKADACTMAQTAAVLGLDPAPYLDGLIRTTASQATDTRDVCILQAATIPAGDPVLLDYEVADGRTAAHTLTFVTQWAALVHKGDHKAVLYSNALDAPSQRWTKLTPVAKQAAESFELISILLWARNAQHDVNQSFVVQQAGYDAAAAKILITFELADTTMDDARTVRGLLMEGKAAGVSFWRNHATQGGDCSSDANRKIACVALGRCAQ